MAAMLEECTSKEQRSVRLFLWKKRTQCKEYLLIKKCLLFTVGSVCCVKQFHLGGKRFAGDKEVEIKVWKWLRQQSKDFYAAGFETLVKRWNKCISVGGGYVEK
jgi:hypothetical protein